MTKVAIVLSVMLTLGWSLPPTATEAVGSRPHQPTAGLGCCL